MKKNICNIIWVDDDIENICPEIGLGGIKRELRKAGIEVIGRARSYYEFEEIMRKFYDIVDAVITDANFNKTSHAPATENDFTGLIQISRVMDLYNQKRVIPFYLYTGKKRYFNTFQNGEFDEFIQTGRFFEKGCDIEKMFQKIKEDVEHINSSSFRIRKKFAKELEAASLISGNEESLMNLLQYEDSEDWKNPEDYFNTLRCIVDAIFSESKKVGIIPDDIGELNQIRTFLRKNEHKTYIMRQEIMPIPLACALWYFLDITQDASHKKDDLRLKVREAASVNLFRSVLYIAMDICLWYAKSKEEVNLPDYERKWDYRDIIIDTEEEKQIEFEGVVKKRSETNDYYCGRFLLQKPKDGKYQDGDTIQILKSEENKRRSFFSDEGIKVDRFVYLCNINIRKK